jgi:hypothetical protein
MQVLIKPLNPLEGTWKASAKKFSFFKPLYLLTGTLNAGAVNTKVFRRITFNTQQSINNAQGFLT